VSYRSFLDHRPWFTPYVASLGADEMRGIPSVKVNRLLLRNVSVVGVG
jgi:hypothetical protein